MSSPEEYPEQFEHLQEPSIVFDYDQDNVAARIEGMTWRDASCQTVLCDSNLPEPFSDIYVQVDGSSEQEGKFGFSTALYLRYPGEYAVMRALESIAHNAGAQGNEQIIHEYWFSREPSGYAYKVWLDEDQTCITAESLGRIDEPDDPVVIGSLRHGKDPFDESFDEFSEFTATLLTSLYEELGINDALMRFKLEPQAAPVAGVEKKKPKLKQSLDDIVGNDAAISDMRDYISELQHPELVEKWGVDRRYGLLLYGPPGTGKTRLIEAFAVELHAKMLQVRSSDIYNMWLGNSEKRIQEIFDTATKTKEPLVLFFDEIEAIVGGREASNARVTGIFKDRAGRLAEENPLVVLAATTNLVDPLGPDSKTDPAILRAGRFDVHIPIGLPDEQGRAAIFAHYASRFTQNTERQAFDIWTVDFGKLAAACEEFSGADIETVMKAVVLKRFHQERRTGSVPEPASTEEILSAVTTHLRNKRA